MKQNKAKFTERNFLVPLAFVTSLFMFWGVAVSLTDVLNRHFQQILHVSRSQSGLVQFSIFGAYFVMGIPAGLFMKRYGYKKGVLLGLALFALGAFLFIPAANLGSFLFFRFALFVLGCGLSTLETVAHPFMASLGDQDTSDQRLNFAQSFNALGTMVGPLIGKYFIFGAVSSDVNGLSSIRTLYFVIGVVITAFGAAFANLRIPPLADHQDTITPDRENTAQIISLSPKERLFQRGHFVMAVIAQFFNVGAQAGTWAYFINYCHDKMGMSDQIAAGYLSLFMLMMLIGRFAGTALMRYIPAARLLGIFAGANVIMCLIVAQNFGWASFVALLMINFFFSIMFPTIFSLGLKNLGTDTQQASSYISMGVVGGAVFPMVMGLVANRDVAQAYYLPIVCYIIILLYAVWINKKSIGNNPISKLKIG